MPGLRKRQTQDAPDNSPQSGVQYDLPVHSKRRRISERVNSSPQASRSSLIKKPLAAEIESARKIVAQLSNYSDEALAAVGYTRTTNPPSTQSLSTTARRKPAWERVLGLKLRPKTNDPTWDLPTPNTSDDGTGDDTSTEAQSGQPEKEIQASDETVSEGTASDEFIGTEVHDAGWTQEVAMEEDPKEDPKEGPEEDVEEDSEVDPEEDVKKDRMDTGSEKNASTKSAGLAIAIARPAGTDPRPRRSQPRISYIEKAPSSASELDSGHESDASESVYSLDAGSESSDDEPNDYIQDSEASDAAEVHNSISDDGESVVAFEDIIDQPKTKKRASTAKTTQYFDLSLPPLSNIDDIFADLTDKALELGFKAVVEHLDRPLNVATSCSGTESPLWALDSILEALEQRGLPRIEYIHRFSAEIDPVKQGFIERNRQPSILFRDVREFFQPENAEYATTAYGAKVKIPDNIDLFIASFSCVDFSQLNRYPKKFEKGGETADTWFAIESYAKNHQPSIILTENVVATKTIWEECQARLANIGYESKYVIADTKKYYLPQTRQRMYMVAINKKKLGSKSKIAMEQWADIMLNLQRPCSAPFASFLVADKSEPQTFNHATNEPNWEMCKLRYENIRSNERLGPKRSLTRWHENGTIKPPDIANRQFYFSQSSRICDAIEVAHLQAAQAGYDSLYKMAIWDVSQNVERFRSTLGIVPAITPGGIDFVSNQHTILSGSQLLLLQGMPMNIMLFANETQKEQQDLAGNAMTTTVIGASIIAALICGRQSFPKLPQDGKSSDLRKHKHERRQVELSTTKHMGHYNLFALNATQLDVSEFARDAQRSSQHCTCEGNRAIAKVAIRHCKDCRHTACMNCAGNPNHKYQPAPESARSWPSDFENKWRQRLPTRLTFKSEELLRLLSKFSENEAFNERVGYALDGSDCFSLGDIHRCKGFWRIVYLSPQATLELRVGKKILWYFTINCHKSVPANDPLRTLLQHPVARGDVQDTLLQPQWKLFIPRKSMNSLTIAAGIEKTSSWRSRIGLIDYKAERTPVEISIRDPTSTLSGEYRLSQECGTAMSSLYKRVTTKEETAKEEPLYLFLDPDPVGPGDLDSFVFAHDCRSLKYGEARETLAVLDPSWRPWNMLESIEKVDSTNKYVLKAVKITLSSDTTRTEVNMPSVSSLKDISKGDCFKATVVLDVRVSTKLDLSSIASYAWALERAKQLPFSHSWDQWIDHTANCIQDACICAPPLPSIRWLVHEMKGKEIVTAQEDPQEAASFERAIKTRPRIFVLEPSFVSGGTRVQVAVNFSSLVHRLRNKHKTNSSLRTKCRLVVHKELAKSSFAKFRLRNNSEDALYDASPLKLGYTLTEAQCRSVGWMQTQELGVVHTITEVEEEVHSALGWRAEAVAELDVKVRGGALADLPSFGKTVTTIGLIHSEFQNNTTEHIIKENSRQTTPAEIIEVATSLIVCPNHLVKQWDGELRNCLGSQQYKRYNVLLIDTIPQLRKLTVDDVRASRVIVLGWNVITSPMYIADLAQFAAIPEPATMKGRGFDAWLHYLIQQIPTRLKELQEKDLQDFWNDTPEALKTRLKEEDFQAVERSKRLKGAAYAAAAYAAAPLKTESTSKTARKPTTVHKHNRSLPGWESHQALLQLFQFNRIVVDEYHLLDGDKHYPALSMLKKLSAHKRWVLSGTPGLSDFNEGNQIATLLGTTLGRASYSNNDQTDVEKFLARTKIMSPQWHQDRHARSQVFLDKFVRQNEPALQHIQCQESLMPVSLTWPHRVVYLELSLHLIEMKMETKKLKADKSDRVERLNRSFDGVSTGEEALLMRALVSDLEEEEEVDASVSGLDALLRIRKQQIEETKMTIYELMIKAEKVPVAPEDQKDPEISYSVFKNDVRTGNFLGEKDTCRELHRLLQKARKNAEPEGETTAKDRAKQLKRIVSDLRSRGQEFTNRHRSLRFVGTLQNLLPHLSSNCPVHHHLACSSLTCSKSANVDSLFVVSLCGHLACSTCLKERPSNVVCVADDCSVSVNDENLIKVSDLRSEGDDVDSITYGDKLGLLCDTIKQIPEDEQAIVFAPNQDIIKNLRKAFKSAGISHHGCDDSEDFQKNRDPKTMKKLIILNLDDEEAAGLNLVNANHVMFISPLLVKKQHDYDAKMAQAIARARRYKQERKVHVYHFVALRTIDVDIMEHRHRRSDALRRTNTVKGSKAGIPFSTADTKEKTKMVQLKDGTVALTPISWLEDEKQCRKLGVDREKLGKKLRSLINFSEKYEDGED